jgi:erythromycin esterase-like protein
MSHLIPPYATLDEWITREAIPFSLDDLGTCDAAVDRVIAALGPTVELLGFGEALHGGKEILLLRNRLFQRLVAAHGYSAIAIESSFPRARLVNEYVAGRGPASYEDVRDTGLSHGFGQLEANRELAGWMRRYNADPSHRVTVRFYGFDQPAVTAGPASPRQVLHFVLDYLASMERASADERRSRIDSLLGPDAKWENPMAWVDPATSPDRVAAATALRIETEDLMTELRTRRPELVAMSDEGRYAEVVRYAAVARELLNFFAALAGKSRFAGSLGVRDALMADNVAYIVARERGRGKVLAFAHNAHLQRGKAQMPAGADVYTWWPAGAHLNEMFGPRYAVIGSAVGVSEANGIGLPEAGTLEARLTATPGPARFIPTHQGQGLPHAEIAALPMRAASLKNPSYITGLTPHSFTDFDWLAVLDSTTYSWWSMATTVSCASTLCVFSAISVISVGGNILGPQNAVHSRSRHPCARDGRSV